MAGKVTGAAEALFTGQPIKAIEQASPEFVAAAMRAKRLYSEGQRTATGQPVYYQGKPVKLSAGEATAAAFGFKSQRRAEIMETLDTEYKLKKYWSNQKKIATKKALSGDKDAMKEFNQSLLKDKTARQLNIKPITGKTLALKKPEKGKTAYELD
jgi:hypothetical protein